MNDKNIIIEKGLSAKTAVWMRTPDDPKKFKLKGNNLISLVKAQEK
jgi:hypothetical protein